MTDAILVLNAGLVEPQVLAVRRPHDAALSPIVGGQVGGIFTTPRFIAEGRGGQHGRREALGRGRGASDIDGRARPHRRLAADTLRRATIAWRPSVIASPTAAATSRAPVRVDAAVVAALEKLVPLAPLHQPHNLAPIRALLERAPGLPQVACFDTAMHRTHPVARADVRAAQGAGRRRRAALRLPRPLVRVHRVGAARLRRARRRAARPSCSTWAAAPACARWPPAAASRARWASPAVDGLPMGTRSGALDPGVHAVPDEPARDGRTRDRDR